jgi:hypothetical protein
VTMPPPLGEVTRDLEALKLRLVEMSADQISSADTEGMAREISAIRLQLKRLHEDQRAIQDRLDQFERDSDAEAPRRDSTNPSPEVGRPAHRSPIH